MNNAAAILAFAGAFLGCALALAVLWQERRSLAHWAFGAGMFALAAESALACLSMQTDEQEEMFDWQTWKLVAMSFLPGLWLLFSVSYGRGNYREFLKRWQFVLITAFVVPVGMAFYYREDLIHVFKGLNTAGVLLHVVLLLSALLVLMNLERTFRASVGTMRWRIKFMILGLGMLFAVRAYTSSQVLLFHEVDTSLDAVNSGALVLACLLIFRTLLRAGHFEVSVYPSQSVIHNSVTILLAGIYLVIVGFLANWVKYIGGDSSFTLKAFIILVALVLLTILLLSDRARLLTRRFVSRHFQRPFYDYRTVWRNFTEGTAACVDQAELCHAAVKLIAKLFEALSVTIWLVDEKKEKLVFAVSTSLSDTKGAELAPSNADAFEVINHLRDHPDPADIDTSKQNWAAVLRQCHPDTFQRGSRVCAPMIAAGELLGVIILGDRVAGVAFSQQDFDLLKCIGDQVAAGLRNVQLSQKLLQARELEAFQTMSAFFVHDLKNTASTLNLMLQNLPVHFDDPAFREDALRGVSKTVNHINQLIGRLGQLRHGLNIQPTETDLNDVVSKALVGWNGALEVELTKDLGPLPKIWIDQGQILTVVINLVLNATEAVSKNGKIRIATNQSNGWATLAVADNGAGMTPEFMSRSLFRPFQTTKKGGFGIGMFQSKMIIEAHRGRMEVESERGKGTTFRIFLPIQKSTK